MASPQNTPGIQSVISLGSGFSPSGTTLPFYTTLSQTGSAQARTALSPFARCTLGLYRHLAAIFIKIYYADSALHPENID